MKKSKVISWIVAAFVYAVTMQMFKSGGVILGLIPAVIVFFIAKAIGDSIAEKGEKTKEADTALRPGAYTTVKPSNGHLEITKDKEK